MIMCMTCLPSVGKYSGNHRWGRQWLIEPLRFHDMKKMKKMNEMIDRKQIDIVAVKRRMDLNTTQYNTIQYNTIQYNTYVLIRNGDNYLESPLTSAGEVQVV